jgi:hypothetical protein
MPYCWKCGSKLEEDAKYCRVCGTPVGQAPVVTTLPPRTLRRRGWRPVYTLAVVLIAILVVGTVVSVSIFMPVRQVNFNQTKQVLAETGVQAIDLNLTADVSDFNVTFADLNGRAMTLNVSATGGVGAFTPADPINVTVTHSRSGNTIRVDARIERNGVWLPMMGGLTVVCDVQIERSLNVMLNAKTNVGRVVLAASSGVVLDSLNLETSTGGVEASLGHGVIVSGNLTVQSTTGSANLNWDNVDLTGDVSVAVRTTTGGVGVDVAEGSSMHGNVTLAAEAVTGGVDFSLRIQDGIGATINSSTTVGSVNTNLTRFSGANSVLQSENYPASSNFIVALKTAVGGITVNAAYETGHNM